MGIYKAFTRQLALKSTMQRGACCAAKQGFDGFVL